MRLLFLLAIVCIACKEKLTALGSPPITTIPVLKRKTISDKNSWEYFLQHLPEKEGPVVDYKGNPVPDQQKSAAIIDYDIGNRDLQQCADALMRIRAEYLFSRKQYADIRFHFTNGDGYTFLDYCSGRRPVPAGNGVRFTTVKPVAINRQTLRRYLDIVYAYAGTISLAKELQPAERFTIGTIVITPGSPGHCFIIVDEATTAAGDPVYKLVEGYTPAQSIYVLQNLSEPQLGYWHRLSNGEIKTATYHFTSYQLKRFK
jgi:hypothetical protein